MKFYVALGLLFASLTHSQQLEPAQAKVDSFLRESQHIKPSAKLISAKQNGSFSTVTYQDGPMSIKYQVKNENNHMKIVGIQQIVSFSSNLQFQPISIQDVPLNPNEMKLPPLPLIMPQFSIQPNGQLSSRNVFDQVAKQMEEMQRKMQQDRQNFHQIMEQKRLELQQRLRRDIDAAIKETPLLGAGNHDFNEATNIQINQQLIGGGDHDNNWATQLADNHPIVGGGDHDYAWVNVQMEPIQQLLGSDDHDFDPEFIPQGPLIGGGQHDNWIEAPRQFDMLIGADDHDNWKVKKEKHHKKDRHQKQRRHHSGMAWMNRAFTGEQIAPFLKEKLPDMMNNAEIFSVQNRGFIWKKGFPLDIQIKGKDGNFQNISVYFKPRSQELLIDKISSVQNIESQNILPVQLASDSKAQKKQVPQENLVALKENSNPSLLGGDQDPDHDPEFMNIVKEIQFTQNNHIAKERQEEIMQVPLLGGNHDIDHAVEEVPLLGGQSDPDHGEKEVEKVLEKSESVFDVTGLPLPGGETDVDHNNGLELVKPVSKEEVGKKIGLDLIKKAIEMVKDIAEDDAEDIEEEVQEPKAEKLQHLIK